MNENQETEFEKSFIHLSSDTEFIKKISNYYPDLADCPNLEFTYNDIIKPINKKDFPIILLTKTRLLNSVKNIDNMSSNEQIKVFDSIYNFPDYYLDSNKLIDTNSECKLRLTFSKKINNLLPIKFRIVENNVDPRINYIPRIGLYIIEFNDKNEIIDSGYLLMTN